MVVRQVIGNKNWDMDAVLAMAIALTEAYV